MDIEAIEGITIEGDIDLEMDTSGGLDPQLAYMLGQETAQIATHFINISRLLGYPVDQLLHIPKPNLYSALPLAEINKGIVLL